MSEKINDGGQVFPTLTKEGELAVSEGGLSLRDYFAAAALTGILACPREYGDAETIDARVRLAFKNADAMLRARGDA